MENITEQDELLSEAQDKVQENLRCGFVAIVGRPSSGKSTFLNYATGGKVSIVSAMPQTTLNAIRGILTNKSGQIIFIDTPGYNNSQKTYNKSLQDVAVQSINDADSVLYLVDATRPFGDEEETIVELLKKCNKPLFVALNKIDAKNANSAMSHLSLINSFGEKMPSNLQIFKISAKTGEGVSDLINHLLESLPISPLLYPEEFYTDQDVPFRISEIIREQIILNTKDEVPHSVYVKIESMKMKKNGKQLEVQASLFVDKESQKGILIGKDASLIKKIRINAEKELFSIFPYYVSLQLRVKTDKNWKQRIK